jgi:hypothetical protein
MIQVNTRVRVRENYSGGLDNVIGRKGKVIKSSGGQFVLDIRGKRQSKHYPGYTFDYPVIVNAGEVEILPYEFKDVNGTPVELGDFVVYTNNNGCLTQGTVVDFKDLTQVRWGEDIEEVKFLLEYETQECFSDGEDRRVTYSVKKRKWLGHSSRTLILRKGVQSYLPIEL